MRIIEMLRKLPWPLALFTSAFILLACSNSTTFSEENSGDGSSSNVEPYKCSGEFKDSIFPYQEDCAREMVHIFAKDSSSYVGTNKPEAKANERPHMKVNFTYDFYIDRHETTCKAFGNLMPKVNIDCDNDSLPVYNVTYFDAVLYANEKSKAENYDTVYTYQNATFDAGGHCVGLEGFAFHPEVEGYRLPTEAEWMLVASKGWDLKKGWTGQNADLYIHNICTMPANAVGVCDMVGNLMELVNDWLGMFADTTVTNFVGAPDGGGVGERVIKGGCYSRLTKTTTIYSRGDVYMVSSSTKTDYIGFRLAMGKIENPTWLDRQGSVSENPVTPLANSMTIRSLTGSYKTKLFFRNDMTGNLSLIDYSNATLTVAEYDDTLDVYHPDVSPDGNWVAFCTGLEGVSGKSTLYVRSVSDRDSSAIKLNVESASIPRWRVLESGDTVIVYVDNAGNNEDDGTFQSSATWQVPFANGKFGTPEKLFNGAYHGGMSSDRRLAVTGSRKLRARIANSNQTVLENAKDTIWYGGEQACNASLAQDGSKRTAFLDFGGTTGREFAGESYGTHERILIADSTGKLVQSISAPTGYTFDHAEWAGTGIVATLANADGAHKKIVYVSPEDSSLVELAEGDELWHPALWSKQNVRSTDDFLFDLDSAGVYYTEQQEERVYVLREKLEDFWKKKDSITLVAMGSSRIMYAVYDKVLPDQVVLNTAYPGADLFAARYLYLNYLMLHAKKLKYLVLELAPDMFVRSEYSHWLQIYIRNPGIKYDAHHGFWKEGIPDGFLELVEAGPTFANKESLVYDAEYMLPSRSWGEADVMVDSTNNDEFDAWSDNNFSVFNELVDASKEAGVKVIAVICPRHPEYKDKWTYGAYGPSQENAKTVIDSISKLDVIVLDENKWGDHDYTDDMAYDFDHLSKSGAIQFTERLDSLIKTLE